MKYLFLLPFFIFDLQLFAQNDVDIEPQDTQEQVDEVVNEDPDSATDPKTVNVECHCPPNEVQAEEAASTLNSIFPAGAVFLVNPEPAPVAPVQKEQEQKEQIPGYNEKLQRGYSDDSYKQIIRE